MASKKCGSTKDQRPQEEGCILGQGASWEEEGESRQAVGKKSQEKQNQNANGSGAGAGRRGSYAPPSSPERTEEETAW